MLVARRVQRQVCLLHSGPVPASRVARLRCSDFYQAGAAIGLIWCGLGGIGAIFLPQKIDKKSLNSVTVHLQAWRDRDTNDIFVHCSLIVYLLEFKFSNYVCPSVLHRLIWFFLKNSFRKKKNIRKTTQNALAPSIFIVLSIALKLGTPLLHTQAQNFLLQNFALEVEIWMKNLQKRCFTLPSRLWRSITFQRVAGRN